MAGRRVALLVAADQFADPGLSALRAPQADISALSELLADADLGGFEVEHLVNGTSQELRVAVSRLLAHRDPDDFCLLHVSSHGLKDVSGELYLATRDTQREFLDATSVEASYLRRQMDRSRAGAAVLFLDCCYGGAFERGMSTRGDGEVDLSGAFVPLNEGRGRAVITASTAIEYAFEGAELKAGSKPEPSVFTEAVVAGLRQGSSNPDDRSVLTLSELFTFVSRRVRQRSTHQTPQWWLYGMSGELVIARNPNPVVTAKALPDDVVDVLAFPQPTARLGAVIALEALLDREPGIALSAYRTLETLATDDSRLVSSAAAEALAGVHVGVTPEVIDFGTVTVGRTVDPVGLQLTGSLAAACQLVVHDAPIRLSRRGAHIDVALDPSQLGAFDGRIEVIGPSGGAAVAVRGEIRAPRSGVPWRRLDVHERVAKSADVHRRAVAETEPAQPIHVEAPRTGGASDTDEALGAQHAEPDGLTRWLWLGWVVVALAGIVGFAHGDSGASWYDRLGGGRMAAIAGLPAPLALLGVQVARRTASRLVWSVVLVASGLVPLIVALHLLYVNSSVPGELVSQAVAAILVVAIASVMTVRLYRRLGPGAAVASRLTTAFVAAFLVFDVVLGITSYRQHDGGVGAFVALGVLALALLPGFSSRLGLSVSAATAGLGATAAVYLVAPVVSSARENLWVVLVGCTLVTLLAAARLRPVWRSFLDLDGH